MGEAGLLMAVPDAGCGGESWWFSFQSQRLVVGGEKQRLFGLETGVLMAVPEAGFGGRGVGCHGSPKHGCGGR